MNQTITALGSDWRALLSLHEKEGKTFDKVNWATLMSKLGRRKFREVKEMKRDKRVSEAERVSCRTFTVCFTPPCV